jgi:lysophospholipase L1-like esterase
VLGLHGQGQARVSARAFRRRAGVAVALVLLLAGSVLAGGSAPSSAGPTPLPLISRGVPVFASSQLYAAANANDADYSTNWRGSIPGWIAYDLSRVPAAQRGQVIVAWYNDPATSPYDHTIVGEVAYNSIRDYTVQANAAAGGTAAPTTGWVTLATVTGNRYHSRTHLVDMTGYNWIRLNITAGDGSSGNSDASFNLDVHDASAGAQDSWIFYGDSITEDGTHHEPINGTGNFSQLIAAARPGTYPAYEDGGTYGLVSADGAQRVATWLTAFPGRYVGLSFGTNDANGCTDANAFYNNYVTMVQAVLNAGKVPVVPTIPWARTTNIQNCGPGFNAKIQALYTAYPQIVKGPDLWTYFKANPTLIGSDGLHPSAAGYAAYRQQWANAMLANVYTSGPAASLAPASVPFGSQPVGTTSATQTVTLTDSGNVPLTISSITVAGANPAEFTETTNCPLGPATLAPGASCAISVAFAPAATGSRAAILSVADTAAGSPQTVALSGTGTAPAVTLTPTGLTFASQPLGTTSAPQSSTLRNSGTAPLAISGIASAGTNAADFTPVHTCPLAPATLAPGATCTISVTFTPGAAGARVAQVAVTDDAAGSPHSLGLSGTGSAPAPAVALTPASLAFGAHDVGTTSAPLASTLRNSGTAPLTISVIDLAGANAADFAQTNDCPLAPATLPAGSSCTISVLFTPSAGGARSAAVTIADDASDSPQSLALTGTGAQPAPAVSLTPTSLAFGSQRVATTSGTLSVTLTDSGNAPLTIGGIVLGGASTGDYAETDDCPVAPATLAAGGSCTIRVSFTPTATGSRTASVAITDDATGSPQAIPLSGSGTQPAVTLTPTSLAFGSQTVGTTSASQSSTLRNSGTAPLAIGTIVVGGANPADFALSTTCPLAPSLLAAGASCTISVSFAPSALGGRSASISVADDAPASPHVLGLGGTGIAAGSIALDRNLGTKTDNVGNNNLTMNTSGAAAARSRVFVFVDWDNATRTLSSVAGGGLTWTIDQQAKATNSNNRMAIASAPAPNGLPTNTQLKATFSGSVGHGLIAAESFTGIAAASPLDGVASTTQGAVAAWSCSLTTTNPNDLVLGWSGIDVNTTSTPGAPSTEVHDFGDVNFYVWGTSVFRIETTAGAKTVNGTWARTAGGTSNLTVCAAYKAG